MTISGQLREFGGQHRPTPERRDAKDISAHDRVAIDRIETMFRKERFRHIGSGRSADVTILDIWGGDSSTRPWVIKEERERTKEQELLGITMENELALHEAAYEAREKARSKNPDVPYAVIPKPLSLLQDEKRRWLLMDYLPGDNLFVHTLRTHLLTFEVDEESRAAIAQMSESEMSDAMVSPTFIATLPARLVADYQDNTIDAIVLEHWRMIALGINRMTRGKSPVLSREQYTAIENTLAALHKAGIHHRDLHAGNIQILPDGTVGIVDFGLALMETGATTEKSRYTIDVGHEFHERKVVLIPDSDALKNFWDVARKSA